MYILYLGHGQYLVSGSKSSIFGECIVVFQVLGNDVLIPCMRSMFQCILMVFHCMVSACDEIATRHFGAYSSSQAFSAARKDPEARYFPCASSARSVHQYAPDARWLVGGLWPVAGGDWWWPVVTVYRGETIKLVTFPKDSYVQITWNLQEERTTLDRGNGPVSGRSAFDDFLVLVSLSFGLSFGTPGGI